MIEYRLTPTASHGGGPDEFFKLEKKRVREGVIPFTKEVRWEYESTVRASDLDALIKHLAKAVIYVNTPE